MEPKQLNTIVRIFCLTAIIVKYIWKSLMQICRIIDIAVKNKRIGLNLKKVQVGNDQEKSQSERESLSKTEVWKKLN